MSLRAAAVLAGLAGFIGAAWMPAPAATHVIPERLPEEIASARELFVLGRESERLGDFGEALRWYGLAYRQDAGSRDLCFLYLGALERAGALDSALSTARECLVLAAGPRGDTATVKLEASEHRLLGQLALRSRSPQAALRHFRAVRDREGDAPDVLFALAALYEDAGDWEAAAEALEALMPQLGPRGYTLLGRLARVNERLGRPEAMIEPLERAFAETGEPALGRALAALYESRGRMVSLLPVARALAELEPGPAQEWALARVYAAADRPDSALVITTRLVRRYESRAARRDPDGAVIRSLHASLLFERGRPAEAAKAAAALVRDFPDAPGPRFLLGSSLLESGKRGDVARALDELGNAVAREPLAPEYRARLAYGRLIAGDSSGAFQVLSYAARGDLDLVRRLHLEAQAYGRLARDLAPRSAHERPAVRTDSALAASLRRAALARYDSLLVLHASHAGALFESGALLEQLGETDAGKARLRRLVALDSSHALAMNYLAYTIVEQAPAARAPGEMDEAGRLLARALALEPENGAYLDSRGWWHYRLAIESPVPDDPAARAHLDSAAAFLAQAEQATPGDPSILEHVVLAQHARGDRDRACAAWHRLRARDPASTMILHCPAPETGKARTR